MTGHSQPVHSPYFSFVRPRRRWLDQFYEPSRDKQDVDLAPCYRVCRRHTHTLTQVLVYILVSLPCSVSVILAACTMGQYLFVVLLGPDPLLILTLFGLLVGGEWWFRRVFYIARFVLLAWDRAARFNSVRTADIAGWLLFSAPFVRHHRRDRNYLDYFFVYKLHFHGGNLLLFCWIATTFMNINNFYGFSTITAIF